MWTSLRMCQTPKQAFSIFKLHTYSYMLNSTTVWILKVVENRKPQEERTDNEQVSSDKCLIMYWKYWLMNLDNTLNQEFRPTLQTSFLLKSFMLATKASQISEVDKLCTTNQLCTDMQIPALLGIWKKKIFKNICCSLIHGLLEIAHFSSKSKVYLCRLL